MHIVSVVVAIVPYRHETVFIQTHHPYKLHSWYLYIKNKCDSVGDDVHGVPISWDFSCFVYIPCGILYGHPCGNKMTVGGTVAVHDVPYGIAMGLMYIYHEHCLYM